MDETYFRLGVVLSSNEQEHAGLFFGDYELPINHCRYSLNTVE